MLNRFALKDIFPLSEPSVGLEFSVHSTVKIFTMITTSDIRLMSRFFFLTREHFEKSDMRSWLIKNI